MKRMLNGIAAALIGMMLLTMTTTSYAQDPNKVVVDRSMLTPEQLAKVQVGNTVEQVQQLGQYAGLGKEIGEGVNGALSAITDNANKFADTKVGVYTMYLVAYKVIGNKVIRLVVGFLMLMVIIPIWIWLLRCNVINHNVLISETIDSDKKKHRQYRLFEPEKNVQASYTLIGILVILGLILFTAA